MNTHRPMHSREAAVVRRVEALFKAMSTDFLLREQFVTDPAQILFEYVSGAQLAPEKASINNQFLYAVMSNARMLRWIRYYVLRHRAHPPSRPRLIKDIARAIVEHGGEHVVLAILRSSIEQQAIANLADIFEIIFLTTIFGSLEPTDDVTQFGPTTGFTNGPTFDPTSIASTDISPTTPS